MAKTISVVIGASSGMGKAVTKELGKRGPIVICSNAYEELMCASMELNDMGIVNYPLFGDVTDFESVKALAEFASAKGDVTYVVNSAGLCGFNPGSGDDGFVTPEQVHAVCALGVVNTVKVFYPLFHEGCVMINFGSQSAYVNAQTYRDTERERIENVFKKWDDPDFLRILLNNTPEPASGGTNKQKSNDAYALAKEFVLWFTKVNAERFGRKGARIMSVSPGCYMTPMHKWVMKDPAVNDYITRSLPLERRGYPYEMACLVDFLCGPGGSYCSGTDFLTDGGYTFAGLMKKDQIPD